MIGDIQVALWPLMVFTGLMVTVVTLAVIAEHAKPGDMVICLGAGSITRWAETLPDELPK